MSFHSPVGSHHLDEYYQIIEFASYRMGITEVHYLPWEFTERIRSWLQPVIAEYFIKSGFVLGFSVLNILWFYRIVHGLFAFSSLVFISSILSKRDNVPIQLFLTAICTSYF